MAVQDELLGFVREALGRGVKRPEIESALLQAGWETDQVRAALTGYADVDFPIPVPKPRPYLSAREAFLYLVLFGTLYISAFQFGSMLFALIERAFPDPALDAGLVAQHGRETIRWAISSLIVAFPIFLFVSRLTNRDIRRDPIKRSSKVRRWLMYLTLFIAASVLIGDVIALVNSLLAGELTIRFSLKVLAIGVIAGAVFGYYLRDLRMEETEGTS